MRTSILTMTDVALANGSEAPLAPFARSVVTVVQSCGPHV